MVWTSVLLTLKLAGVTTLLLLLMGTPVAWWLATTHSRWRGIVNAIIALPLILPPTVLGFYLLIFLGKEGPLGRVMSALGMQTLPFTFWGLVVGSFIYSLPFVVQPIQHAFESIGKQALEAAATLGAGPWDRFLNIALPMSKVGFMSAAVLGFAHTVGEFGVVLMLGGNIPGETQVLSIAIYDLVEALDYSQANHLALGLVLFSFFVLFLLYSMKGRPKVY